MTQEEFDKAPLLDQVLYDTTGMLVENHPCIADAMDKYHQAKLKLLGIADASGSLPSLDDATEVAVRISEEAIIPPLDAKGQAMFIAGFQECIKWLNVVFSNDH